MLTVPVIKEDVDRGSGTAEELAPAVTIGMPVYNGAKYIEQALDSILAQTYTDFELLISDNASTDATEAICRRYAEADSRVRYSRNAKNLGAAANYNRVIHLARGRYFRHAAHDDLLAPTNIERCVDVLDRYPDVVLAYPRMVMIDAAGEKTGTREHSLELEDARPSARFAKYARLCDDGSMCDPVFGLFRTGALRETNLLGAYIAADMILLGEMALRGRIVEVPEYLFFERYHAEGSVLSNPTLDDRAAWFDLESRGKLINQAPYFRWLWELSSAIARVTVSPLERAACFVAMRHWLWHNKRGLVTDAARVLRTVARAPARR
jgi:glycosyltransferase involved in cell wall biosynthesis